MHHSRLILITLFLVFGIIVGNTATFSEEVVSCTNCGCKEIVQTKKWWDGGTLHDKSGLDWQTASKSDKLATCADLIGALWDEDALKRSISSKFSTFDDLRPYARDLVAFLDAVFERGDLSPERNRQVFGSQIVSTTAAIGVLTLRWTK